LVKYDALQTCPDRVSARFRAGHLRADMEAWARGEAASDMLRMELLSYQPCKLDDTWAETCHRDVSRDGSRTTHASQAWVSASLRLRQNLDLWDRLDAPMRLHMHEMLRRWTAIGHIAPRRACALTRRKITPKALLPQRSFETLM
jgi:hypothetical protein